MLYMYTNTKDIRLIIVKAAIIRRYRLKKNHIINIIIICTLCMPTRAGIDYISFFFYTSIFFLYREA